MNFIISLLESFIFNIIGRWTTKCRIGNQGRRMLIGTNEYAGIRVSFYYRVIIYTVVFKRWWIPNRTVKVLEFSSTTSKNAGRNMRLACQGTVSFPTVSWLPSSIFVRFYMQMYIDVIRKRKRDLEDREAEIQKLTTR